MYNPVIYCFLTFSFVYLKQQSQDGRYKCRYGSKALLGNGLSLFIMVIGVILTAVYDDQFAKHCPEDLRWYNSTKLDEECIGKGAHLQEIDLYDLSSNV